MIEKATAAPGAMWVIDWKRTGPKPIASRWSRDPLSTCRVSVPTCPPPAAARREIQSRPHFQPPAGAYSTEPTPEKFREGRTLRPPLSALVLVVGLALEDRLQR